MVLCGEIVSQCTLIFGKQCKYLALNTYTDVGRWYVQVTLLGWEMHKKW